MSKLTATFAYSIGKKVIMAVTGLFLITFLPVHLLGNVLLIVGDFTKDGGILFAEYAHFMGHNPLIRTAEIILFAGFAFHIVDGLWLALQNSKARPQKYATRPSGVNSTWFSRNMNWTGTVILAFLVVHLISFWFMGRLKVDIPLGVEQHQAAVAAEQAPIADEYVKVTYGSELGPQKLETLSHDIDLGNKVIATFRNPIHTVLYVLAMIFIAFHLNHGFESAFRTMGWVHPKYMPLIKGVGKAYAILIPAAFAFIPIYFLITK